MLYPESFKLSLPSDREIQVTRDFHAPRQLVFDAFTKPELVRQWLLGPPGWTMPVCEIDLRVGGRYRYVWRKPGEKDMGIGGVFREIVVPGRVVATEQFDQAWYPGEAVNTTVFAEEGDITRTTITILYESRDARDTASRSGMEHGMAASYNRLEEVLTAFAGTMPKRAGIRTPEVVETSSQIAAVIHLTIPREQMQLVMPAAIQEIMTTISGQGLTPVGPLFAHHLKMSNATFDFEVGFPVNAPVKPAGRVTAGELPGARIARSVYQGPYEGLFQAWTEFGEWMKRQGLGGRGDLWEKYVRGPESSPDPGTWLTELCLPLQA